MRDCPGRGHGMTGTRGTGVRTRSVVVAVALVVLLPVTAACSSGGAGSDDGSAAETSTTTEAPAFTVTDRPGGVLLSTGALAIDVSFDRFRLVESTVTTGGYTEDPG